MSFKAMAHQKESIAFLKKNERVFDTSDAGTGKTYVQIMDFAARRKAGGKCALVLATKSLLQSAWEEDIKKFAPHLKTSVAWAVNREAAFKVDADIYITNHDAAKWLVKQPPAFFKRFDTLIIDESTAMKHRTSGRSKAVAKIAKHFTWRRLMSGTPMTNGVCDVWHQMYIVDDGKRLGKSFFAFRSAVCIPEQTGPQTNMVKWIDKPGAEATVSALIKDVVIRHRFEDCVDIPTNHRRAVTYHLPKSHMRRYKELEQEGLLLHKEQKITAINGAVLYGKLLQLASGAVYDEQGDYALIDTERYELTIDLVEERQHSVVFFYWQHQRDQLVRLAEARGLSYAVYDGSVTSAARRKEITDHFQAGFYRVIFAHPKSAAHGLTWTKATATIWPSATPNLEWYLQGLKRIHRIGQDEKTETIMIIAPGTIEERVYQSLNDKDAKQLTLLDFLKETA